MSEIMIKVFYVIVFLVLIELTATVYELYAEDTRRDKCLKITKFGHIGLRNLGRKR